MDYFTAWLPWGPWTGCSSSCGIGERQRIRACANGEPGRPGCMGQETEIAACNGPVCSGKFARKAGFYLQLNFIYRLQYTIIEIFGVGELNKVLMTLNQCGIQSIYKQQFTYS